MKRRTFFKTSAFASPALLLSCRYSEDNAEQGDSQIDKVILAMLSMQRASWEQGIAAQALLELGKDELVFLMAKEAALRQFPDGRLSVLYVDNGVTDPAASGSAVLYAANKLNDSQLRKASENMLQNLLTTKHKTIDGILHHTLDRAEIWVDSMYMAPPFLADAGAFEEAIKQIEGIRQALWNREKKLYAHRWDVKNQKFINEKFWGVGNGWALAGISRVIELLPAKFDDDRERLIRYEIEHLNNILQYNRSDGLFHNTVDDPDSFIETNLSQMSAYTIYSGVRAGWLEPNMISQADQMREAVINKIDEFGFVQGVCGAPHFNSPGRATEGQAFFILMEAARKKFLESA